MIGRKSSSPHLDDLLAVFANISETPLDKHQNRNRTLATWLQQQTKNSTCSHPLDHGDEYARAGDRQNHIPEWPQVVCGATLQLANFPLSLRFSRPFRE